MLIIRSPAEEETGVREQLLHHRIFMVKAVPATGDLLIAEQGQQDALYPVRPSPFIDLPCLR